jgi:hypothetical protein
MDDEKRYCRRASSLTLNVDDFLPFAMHSDIHGFRRSGNKAFGERPSKKIT